MTTKPVQDDQHPDFLKQVRLARKGDQSAFSFLIRGTQDRLFRFCSYLAGNPALAQDLCQDTYIKALEQLSKLKQPERFVGWLFKTSKNLFLDHIKGAKYRDHLSIDSIAEVPDTLGLPEGREIAIQIHQAMRDLTAEERMILLLVDLEGYTYAETAEIIGISESNIRFKLHHIRKAFAVRYQE